MRKPKPTKPGRMPRYHRRLRVEAPAEETVCPMAEQVRRPRIDTAPGREPDLP